MFRLAALDVVDRLQVPLLASPLTCQTRCHSLCCVSCLCKPCLTRRSLLILCARQDSPFPLTLRQTEFRGLLMDLGRFPLPPVSLCWFKRSPA